MTVGLLTRRSVMLAVGAAAAAPQALAEGGHSEIPGSPTARPESLGMSSRGLAKINALMAQAVAEKRVTGGVTAVARRNRLVHYRAHGLMDAGAGVPMRIDAEFNMASSTKPVTGVALLQQIDRGKVHLDDPISKFIPELKTMRGVAKPGVPPLQPGQSYTPDQIEPQAREITIRDLATHTSGLNAMGRQSLDDTLATAVPRLRDTVLDFQPGSRWGYSAATGPDVLARVVEIISGQSYDRYLQQHIFDPVGMKDTGYELSAEQRARRVKLYTSKDGAWIPVPPSPLFDADHTTYFAGSYGLFSTARDYLLFETMLLNKGVIHGKRVLSEKSVELMRTNLVGNLYQGLYDRQEGTGFGVLVRVIVDSKRANVGRENGAFGWEGMFGTISWNDPALELAAVLMIQTPDHQLMREFQTTVRAATRA